MSTSIFLAKFSNKRLLIAQKSVEPVFTLDTNYFKPTKLDSNYFITVKFLKVILPLCNIKVYTCMFDYLQYFPCQSIISGLRLINDSIMLDYGTLQNFLHTIHAFDNFTFICYYTQQND